MGSEAVEPASRPPRARLEPRSMLCARFLAGYPHPADYTGCPECMEHRTGEVQLRGPSEVTREQEQMEQERVELRKRARARIRAIRGALPEDSEGSAEYSPALYAESLQERPARAQPQQASGYRGVMLDSDQSRLYSQNELVDRLEEAWQKGKRHGECWSFPHGFADGYSRAIDNVAEGSGYDRAKVVSWTGGAGEPGPKSRRVA